MNLLKKHLGSTELLPLNDVGVVGPRVTSPWRRWYPRYILCIAFAELQLWVIDKGWLDLYLPWIVFFCWAEVYLAATCALVIAVKGSRGEWWFVFLAALFAGSGRVWGVEPSLFTTLIDPLFLWIWTIVMTIAIPFYMLVLEIDMNMDLDPALKANHPELAHGARVSLHMILGMQFASMGIGSFPETLKFSVMLVSTMFIVAGMVEFGRATVVGFGGRGR